MLDIEIRHFHLFCGIGGGARGFNRGEARVGNLSARFRCLGGVDVLAMTWADYDSDYIKVVAQQKTGAKVEIYCHHTLKAELEAWRRSQRVMGPTILTRYDGRPLSYNRVRNRATEILKEIERPHLQLRDLRRTAATTLAEAGCTVPQIAAITGHSIEKCQRILDTYVVRTKATSRAAIEKLEAFDRASNKSGVLNVQLGGPRDAARISNQINLLWIAC